MEDGEETNHDHADADADAHDHWTVAWASKPHHTTHWHADEQEEKEKEDKTEEQEEQYDVQKHMHSSRVNELS